MDREEAIKILGPKTSKDTLMEYMGNIWNQTQALMLIKEAQKLGLIALRAQQTPLDRSKWEGCEQCITGHTKPKFDFVYVRGKYCQKCGRPLNERAWAELERRINCGKTD